ncbi:MAG: dethiobiotin synthase [Candidatus Dadabacteria bacterium]|nr:MAG: dethiobiotin synthase [Candidatus Dadabacteria bacterium]
MKLFVTANHTGAGKTLVSAILVEALKADYWKPVQCGNLEKTDSDTVQELISNDLSYIFPERYRLKAPMSPHAAAAKEGVEIKTSDFSLPETDRPLVIEGAGGVLVPLNDSDTMLDLIKYTGSSVVFVSRHYLGSINHTLLSLEVLKTHDIKIAGIIFNGPDSPASEEAVLRRFKFPVLGRIKEEISVDRKTVLNYAKVMCEPLKRIAAA